MLQLAFVIVLLLCFESVQGQEFDLESYCTRVTRNGRKICTFTGIPYAEPPVGPLRFRNPVPLEWTGQINITDGNQCPQFNDAGVLVGDEDCLYLNVYRPAIDIDEALPVMVYFHGGNFIKGSGRSMDVGPEYLLDRDIFLVTVNYRLGVLGFLSTGDEEAPGNFGLKDQVLALQWVQENINILGGNPGAVTIFGDGISTALHAISSASNGLFHRFISQSGNIWSPWTYHKIRTYKKRATSLGEYLNCPTINSQVLVDCLRNIDSYSLVDSNDIFKIKYWTINTWGPTEEPDLPGAFLTSNPEDTLSAYPEKVKDIPAILGNVADEGLEYTVDLIANDTLYDEVASDPYSFFTYLATYYVDGAEDDMVGVALYSYFFNNTDVSDKENFIKTLTDLITDIAFIVPMKLQIQGILSKPRKSPIYFYSFNYRGTLSHTSVKTGDNEDIGVTHGDDLIYLFPPGPELKNGSSSLELSESDGRMIDIMIDFWTSFAYTGKPTSSRTSDPNVWEAYDEENMSYLEIGNDTKLKLTTGYQLNNDTAQLWTNFGLYLFGIQYLSRVVNGR